MSVETSPGSPAAGADAARRTIVIDLDGTLLLTDSLIEALLLLLRDRPLAIFNVFSWLLQGKTTLKEKLCQEVSLDVRRLPYNQPLIDWAKERKAVGARLVLATASHRTTAEAVAAHLGIFDAVLASDASRNLKSAEKRDELVSRYGAGGFEYVGDARADLPVWKSAARAHAVNPGRALRRDIARHAEPGREFSTRGSAVRTFLKAIRIHQWSKNLLLFVPLLAAHKLTDLELLLDGALAFALFGLTSSGVYLLNDLIDLEGDRRHATKRHRPLASGQLPQATALLAIPLFIGTGLLASLLILPAQFAAVLLAYFLLALAYNFWLKPRVLVDVMTLAVLYTLRILAGVAVFELVATFWMLAFSMFLFLSLAFVKRYAELHYLRRKRSRERTPGRGYYPDDFELLASLGCASGYVSVLVLALYIQDSTTRTLYSRPELVWLSCLLLLFWISRTWLITHRGEMHDDPVVFALKDNVSRWVGLLFVLTFLVAL